MANRTYVNEERLNRHRTLSLGSWADESPPEKEKVDKNVSLDCGWGNLIFAHTFSDHDSLIKMFQQENQGRRDLAFYTPNPHVLIAKAPNLLFIDPSDTYRLWINHYRMPKKRPRGFSIRFMQDEQDACKVNEIYKKCGMVTASTETMIKNQYSSIFQYFVAIDEHDHEIIGTIMGVDHHLAFQDPDQGASFWCLAIDPKRQARGVGRALVRCVIEYFLTKGRIYIDLSVLHDNTKAVRLYKDLGFQRVPVFTVKRKNKINKTFYTGGPDG